MRGRIITRDIMNQVYEKDGWLYWNVRKSKIQKDSLAGCLCKSTGYYVVTINGKSYKNHRILYQIYNNVILEPDDIIDHIDMDKTNNSKENLRIVNDSQNNMNRITQKNNLSTGHKNISILRQTKYNCNEYYLLTIRSNDKKYYRRYFRTDKYTLQEVIEIRNKKLLELHGEFVNFG